MKTILRLAAILVLLASPAAFARVLSYAPYSDALGTRMQQSRDRRYVLAAERRSHLGDLRFVVYDSAGGEEPRHLRTGSAGALYESGFGATPVILIRADRTVLTTDFGATWISVPALDGYPHADAWPREFGGPFARGLAGPIQLGNARYPFVVESRGDIFAIGTDGLALKLATSSRLLGRNRDGTRFLIGSGGNVSIIDFEGRTAPVAKELTPDYGWITSDGSVYTVTPTPAGVLRLRFHQHQQESFKTGRGGFFAVPTADFDGAWMVQQDDGQPTTLSRHLAREGEEEMWSDSSGPKIEALIPGASGETLLIQAVLPRATTETVFRGVAVALWRTGDGAPAEYDELLARIGPGHGFARVDPDNAASGSTFVFDTAFTGSETVAEVITPRRPPAISGGADVLQEWGIVRGSFRQFLVLPAVSRVEGWYGAQWLTDVVLYNPLDTRQDVTVRYESVPRRLTLAPREIRVIADVLDTLFGLQRGGGPMYFHPEKSMTVTSRTYTGAGGGAMSYSMDAVDTINGATPRFPYAFAGAFPAGQFRTNLLLTEVSGRGSEVVLQANRTQVAVNVLPNATLSLGRVDPWLARSAGLMVTPRSGELMATVVAIDNLTNDPTYFPPDLASNDGLRRIIPEVVHADLGEGWQRRSDLYVFNPSDSRRYVHLEVKPFDTDQWPRGKGYWVQAGQTLVLRDVLQTEFDLDGRSRLRVAAFDGNGNRSGPSPLRVTSHTYLADPNGGTRGMLMPPLNNFQLAAEGETLELVAHTGTSRRLSLGLLELTVYPQGDPSIVRIHLLDDRGNSLDTFDHVLRPAHGLYIDDLFRDRNLPQPTATRIVVEVVRSKSLIAAYGVLTDVATKDMAYVGANHGGTPR